MSAEREFENHILSTIVQYRKTLSKEGMANILMMAALSGYVSAEINKTEILEKFHRLYNGII